MAMELDIIKTDTTWNDAAASLNNNFGKVKQAIAMGGGSGSGIVDSEMSDTSTNPVQNKVVKKYIDDYDVYLEGYAEGVANDAEAAAKKYTDERIAQIESGIDPELAKRVAEMEQRLTAMEEATIMPLYEKQ